MEKYNVAIVGCGSMGVENLFEVQLPFTYSFAGAVLQNPRTQLIALVDSDRVKLKGMVPKLARSFPEADRHLFEETYSTLEDALIDNNIDIVCCAAGPKTNAEIIRGAQKHNIQGVYCEKPMTLSLAEADELAQIENSSDVKVQVNYLRNFDTHHLAVVGFIRNGGLGDLLTVRVLYKGGVLAVFPHATALLNLLFDGARAVSGIYSPLLNTRCLEDPNIDGMVRYFFAPQSREINVQVTATGRGEIENNTYLFEFEFTGTKGRISILENGWRTRYEAMESSRVFGSLGEMMPYDTARIPSALKVDTPREFIIEGLGRLITSIESQTATTCNAVCARDAEEIVHALAISATCNGQQVQLPLPDRVHAFANTKAGIKILKEEAGLKS